MRSIAGGIREWWCFHEVPHMNQVGTGALRGLRPPLFWRNGGGDGRAAPCLPRWCFDLLTSALSLCRDISVRILSPFFSSDFAVGFVCKRGGRKKMRLPSVGTEPYFRGEAGAETRGD
eukprot:COSAG02_NODE_616_length_19505_cov_5.004998_19_plen_118_part_00